MTATTNIAYEVCHECPEQILLTNNTAFVGRVVRTIGLHKPSRGQRNNVPFRASIFLDTTTPRVRPPCRITAGGMRWSCRSNALESGRHNCSTLIFLAAASLTAINVFVEIIRRVIDSIVVHVAQCKRMRRNHKCSARNQKVY